MKERLLSDDGSAAVEWRFGSSGEPVRPVLTQALWDGLEVEAPSLFCSHPARECFILRTERGGISSEVEFLHSGFGLGSLAGRKVRFGRPGERDCLVVR